jgi:hypothetical protein
MKQKKKKKKKRKKEKNGKFFAEGIPKRAKKRQIIYLMRNKNR